MTPITIWKRFAEPKGPFEHNHIEDGHCPPEQRIPTIKHEAQRRHWSNGLWIQRHAYLNGSNQIVEDFLDSRSAKT